MKVEELLLYTVEKRGRLYWQPTKEMRALGFEPRPLGPDSPEARAEARKLAAAWAEAQQASQRVTSYPAGSFGAFWDRLRGHRDRPTAWWTAKGARTRDDYHRAWQYIDTWRPTDKDGEVIGPTLARTVCTAISTELCEQFYAHLQATVSPSERWRAVKGLKILLDDMVVRLRLGYASPAAKLVNPQPKGRAAIWLGAEIEELCAIAAIAGFEGMSLAIQTAWETMYSPVDVRTLRPSQLRRDAGGFYFTRRRTKTSAEAFAAISDDLAEQLQAYLGRQSRAEADDTPIFRSREPLPGPGRPWASAAYATKDTFAKDFRLVREIFSADDDRQLLDIRRSANVEADAAGADKKTMGELLANGLADSSFLEETYTPPTVAKAREVAALRLEGRHKLEREVTRLRRANAD